MPLQRGGRPPPLAPEGGKKGHLPPSLNFFSSFSRFWPQKILLRSIVRKNLSGDFFLCLYRGVVASYQRRRAGSGGVGVRRRCGRPCFFVRLSVAADFPKFLLRLYRGLIAIYLPAVGNSYSIDQVDWLRFHPIPSAIGNSDCPKSVALRWNFYSGSNSIHLQVQMRIIRLEIKSCRILPLAWVTKYDMS